MPLSTDPLPGGMKPSKTNRKRRKKKKKKTAPPAPPSQGSVPDAGDISNSKKEEGEDEAEEGEDEDRRTLNWLIDAFSSASLHQINSAYREAQGDPYKAADILGALSVDLQGCESGSGSPAIGRKKGAGSRKQKRVVASTGLVSNVIGKDHTRAVPRDGGRRSDAMGPKGLGKEPFGIEEAEEFLCSMLGDSCELDLGVVKDVFGHCGYDVEKALDTLLDMSVSSSYQFRDSSCGNYSGSNSSYLAIPLERSHDDHAGNNSKNFQLMDMTDDSAYHPFEREHECLPPVGNGCRDYAKVLTSPKEQSSSWSGVMQSDLQQKVLESLFNIPGSSKHEPNCMNWMKIVKKVENFGQGLEFCSASITEPLQKAVHGKADGYHVFRSVTRQHWDTMKSYYQKAAMAYSKGERAHATYLSEQGKLYGKLAREAEEKASREIFEARNKGILNAVTIDLHGQHVKQAIGLLKLHLLLFTYIPSIQFLKVITGCGTHGVGKGKLKQSVIALVEKEGIEWGEENPGTLVIRLDGLKKWNFVNSESDSE